MSNLKLYIAATALTLSANAFAIRPQHADSMPCIVHPEKKSLPMPKRAASTAQEVEVTVKISLGLDYVPAMGYPLRAYNNKVSEAWAFDTDAFGDFEGKISLPAGIYDFMLMTDHVDRNHQNDTDRSAVVILENVEINESTVIELDPSTATNHIAFKSYTHEGELAKQKTERYIDSSTTELVEAGNVGTIGAINEIIHSDYNMLDYTSLSSYRILLPSEAKNKRNDGIACYDFWVNKVSEKYQFRQVRQISKDDGSCDIVILSHNGCDKELIEVVNDYSDYFNTKIDVATPPVSEGYEPMEGTRPYTLYVGATLLGGEIPGLMQGMGSANPNLLSLWVSPGQSNTENPMAVAYWSTIPYETETTYYNHATPPMYLVKDGKSQFAIFAQDRYAQGEMGQAYGRYYAGHPALAFDFDDNNLKFQETTPFCLMSFSESYDFFNNRNDFNFAAQSYGQMGELRGADKVKTTYTIHYNGEEVLQDMDLMYEWPMDWAQTEHEPGEYIFKAINENVKIDGIEGKNVAELYFDERNDEFYPPVLQMIQTREKSGKLNVRFNNSIDGELRIVGGDFNRVINYPYEGDDWFQLWYEMAPADLKVEYAPNGTEDFREITSREDYNGYSYWGFNDTYIVPLDEVSLPSDNKWYDLRITFSDEAGNYQKQLLSPAFRIDNPKTNGINTVTSNSGIKFRNGVISCDGIDNARIEVYDTAGRIVYAKDGNIATLDISKKGVYIVKVSGSNESKSLKITI